MAIIITIDITVKKKLCQQQQNRQLHRVNCNLFIYKNLINFKSYLVLYGIEDRIDSK